MSIGAGQGSGLNEDTLRYVVATLELIVGVGLLLTPLWASRSRVRLQSSNPKSRSRHVLLFTVAGGFAFVSGMLAILGIGDWRSTLIPLAMVGAALATALIPGNPEKNEGEELLHSHLGKQKWLNSGVS